jgi:serine palmitoyltransferase
MSCLQDADGSGRGPEKLRNLKDNSNYFRAALLRMGLTVLGDWDSPVMVRPPSQTAVH